MKIGNPQTFQFATDISWADFFFVIWGFFFSRFYKSEYHINNTLVRSNPGAHFLLVIPIKFFIHGGDHRHPYDAYQLPLSVRCVLIAAIYLIRCMVCLIWVGHSCFQIRRMYQYSGPHRPEEYDDSDEEDILLVCKMPLFKLINQTSPINIVCYIVFNSLMEAAPNTIFYLTLGPVFAYIVWRERWNNGDVGAKRDISSIESK